MFEVSSLPGMKPEGPVPFHYAENNSYGMLTWHDLASTKVRPFMIYIFWKWSHKKPAFKFKFPKVLQAKADSGH